MSDTAVVVGVTTKEAVGEAVIVEETDGSTDTVGETLTVELETSLLLPRENTYTTTANPTMMTTKIIVFFMFLL